MAIYKNREVYLVSTFVPSNTNVDLVAVSYINGMRDNVPLNQVYFTEDEKKALIKDNPSRFEDVSVATKEDIEAVRIGVTPPSDPVYKEQAELKAQRIAQEEKSKEMTAKADAEAKKNFEKKVSTPTTTPVTSPQVKNPQSANFNRPRP